MEAHEKSVIVIGGGLAGLACAMKVAEAGFFVHLVSLTKVKRSHSVCAQGGINAALNMKDEGDSPFIHAYETIKGGDFLADQPPVVEMCLTAPKIIQMMDRLGCPFNRTMEGRLDVRRFGGSLYSRTVFCGASTGQQLLYTLDEQVRRYEAKGRVVKYENHEFLRLVHNEDHATCGIVMMDLYTMRLMTLSGCAVVNATGGLGALFRKSTNSLFCTGSANGRLYMQGMEYANAEFIQIHPTAIPGEDKLRLMSESARGEGGRIWVPGKSDVKVKTPDGRTIPAGVTGKPWYFLEELYPAYGNLVPRDIAAREILKICELGLGVQGGMQVYLDVSHLPKERLKKLESILEIYHKFTGNDPAKFPMMIFPAVHYSMGGAWVDWPASDEPDRALRFRQMTNIPGLFAIGEADFQYHGANRLGANALLSCIFSGLVAAKEIVRYVDEQRKNISHIDRSLFDQAVHLEEQKREELYSRVGDENIFHLHDELASLLVRNVTVKRINKDLENTLQSIKSIRMRSKNAPLSDRGMVCNQVYQFTHQFEAMLALAEAITFAALRRNESRGSHYKEEYPNRDDEHWLKTSIVSYHEDEPIISYKPVDVRYIQPEQRDYTKAHKGAPEFQHVPEQFDLPL